MTAGETLPGQGAWYCRAVAGPVCPSCALGAPQARRRRCPPPDRPAAPPEATRHAVPTPAPTAHPYRSYLTAGLQLPYVQQPLEVPLGAWYVNISTTYTLLWSFSGTFGNGAQAIHSAFTSASAYLPGVKAGSAVRHCQSHAAPDWTSC